MTDLISVSKFVWNRKNTLDLISSYHARPQLWDTGCDDYKNPAKRKEALQEITQTLQCSTNDVEKKINSIRAQFFREQDLVEAKKQTGTEERYKPKWYAYKRLQFLTGKSNARTIRKQPVPVIMTNSLKVTDREHTAVMKDTSKCSDETTLEKSDERKVNEIPQLKSTSQTKQEGQICQNIPTRETGERFKTPAQVSDSTFTVHSDEFSIFGEYVACTLRKLNGRYLQSNARHEISDILYHAEAQDYQSDNCDAMNYLHGSTNTLCKPTKKQLNSSESNASSSKSN